MSEALYRKYRPQVFEDVVGQEPVEHTIKNAIAQDKVSHAYLLCGPRGTGKTTTARLLAKALLCQKAPTATPDGTCEDCRMIAEGTHPDVYELDAASRTGVENVREEIIGRVNFAPTRGAYKIYIIDEVHMLSTAAFNSLLKTLEEPPGHVVFMLCTTDPHKVPDTIQSRCQRFDFHRISQEDLLSRLKFVCDSEGVQYEEEALRLIALRADGGLRDALTSLDQIIAFEGEKVSLEGAQCLLGSIVSSDLAELLSCIGTRDIAACFNWVAKFAETGADFAQFVHDMSDHVRNLYVMAVTDKDVKIEVSQAHRKELQNELQWFGSERLARMLGILGDLSIELKTAINARLAFEIALTRLVRPDSDLSLEALAERIEVLEQKLAGAPVAAKKVEAVDEPAHATASKSASKPSKPSKPASESVDASTSEPASEQAPEKKPALSQEKAPEDRPEDVPAPQQTDEIVENEQASNEAESAPQTGDSQKEALLNPATVARMWQAVLSEIKKHKQAYGVLFMNTRAAFNEKTNSLEISFSTDAPFTFSAVQKDDVRAIVSQAIEKAAGRALNFEYVTSSPSKSDDSASHAADATERHAPNDSGDSPRPSQDSSHTPSHAASHAAPSAAAEPAAVVSPQENAGSVDSADATDTAYTVDAAHAIDATDTAGAANPTQDTADTTTEETASHEDADEAQKLQDMLQTSFGGSVEISEAGEARE